MKLQRFAAMGTAVKKMAATSTENKKHSAV
jgi:hypothetical protein